VKYILEYIPLRIAVFILSILPRSIAMKIGKGAGSLACRLMTSRYRIARQNILEALPGTSENDVRGIVKGCWQNLGLTAAEIASLPSIDKEKFFSIVDAKGLEHAKASHAKGKGFLMIGGHYGPWEFTSHIFAFSGIPTAAVARRIKNPHVDELVNHYRTLHGNEVMLSKNAVRNSMRALKDGKMVGILIDHRVAEGGLQIPFLGKPAHTTSLPAILALRLQIPVHFIRAWREAGKIKVEILPAMDFTGVPNSPEGIDKATRRMSRVFEDWVREKPENWLWIHNRWKT